MSFIETTLADLKRLESRLFTVLVAASFYSFGGKSTIIPPLRSANLRKISVGYGVTIHRDCWIQVIGEDPSNAGPVISIGDQASIGMGATISATRRIVIGDYALLGRNVYISDHGHQYENVSVPVSLQGIRKIAEVRIGRGAWLGQNAVVLPGVSIGENSVIGANSVVCSSIPDFCVAVGSPARIVRRYNSKQTNWEKTE